MGPQGPVEELLGQDQLAIPGQAEPIPLTRMLDEQFPLIAQ